MTNKTREQEIESDDAYVVLMNTTFKDSEIEHSDIGTCYLSSRAVKRILKDLESLGMVFKDTDQSFPPFNRTLRSLPKIDIIKLCREDILKPDKNGSVWIKVKKEYPSGLAALEKSIAEGES